MSLGGWVQRIPVSGQGRETQGRYALAELYAGDAEKDRQNYGRSFPRVTPHVLRHTFCTDMQRAGIDVKSLQYLMGHSNVSVTLDIYTHVNFDAVEEAFGRAVSNL